MTTSYTYNIASDFTSASQVNSTQFKDEIDADGTVSVNVDYINQDDGDVIIWFPSALSAPQKTGLDALVSAYTYAADPYVKLTTTNASFGSNTTLHFAQTGNRVLTMPDVTDTVAVLAASQDFSNKNLIDDSCSFVDQVDTSKKLSFSLGGASASTNTTIIASQTVNRTVTLPNATTILLGKDNSDTVTNKTIDYSNNTLIGFAPAFHTHAATDVISGTFANARISEGSVTQHESAIVHQNISGAGSNTHAQIDTHIADSTIHFTQANITTTGALNSGSITSGFGAIDVGADNISTSGNVNAGNVVQTGYTELVDMTAPANPGAGLGRLYKKTGDDGIFWKPDAAGSEVDLTGAGSPTITYHEVTATATTSTTSSSYVLINGMTYIPPASGTYFVTFSSSGKPSGHRSDYFYAIYSGGSLVTHSERVMKTGGSQGKNTMAMQTQAVVTVNGFQAIEARYKTSTFEVYERSMFLWKIA